MGLARGVGKSARHQQQVASGPGVRPVQLGEAQVVAHAQAHPPAAPIAGEQVKVHGLLAGFYDPALVVMLLPVVETKKVDLVVARDTVAAGVKHQCGVAHPVGRRGLHRQRPAHNPDLQCPCGVGQKTLDHAIAFGLAAGQFVGVLVAHQAKIFRQHGQLGAAVGRLLQQRAGYTQVVVAVGAGHHLQGGNFHGVSPVLAGLGLMVAASSVASAGCRPRRGTRTTRGSSQVPSM